MATLKEIYKKRLESYKHVSPKQVAIDYTWILIGTFIMSIGIIVFQSPLKLAPGGVYGIAIILHHLFNFPIGWSGICMDLPLLLIGTLWLGGKFGLKTLVGLVSLSGFNTMWEHIYGYDPLITIAGTNIADPSASCILSLCGAALVGFGLGLILRARGTSGGTDIISMIISKYLKHVPIGNIIICVDSFIVLSSLIAFKDWTIPLYSWLSIYVTGAVVDKMIAGFSSYKGVIIVSEKHEEIREKIITTLKRGGTYLQGEGMSSLQSKKVIFTSVSPKQVPILMYIVHNIDPKAFITVLDASETIGNGFTSLEEKVTD
ncbi:MAG: YitT family protein [Bacteroidales bacterium]|nr:YitT family protein [Bacteroidales bacterium]